ncbi:recombinase family protein [Thiothrix fructosivorans]|uniref:Recombinase family protein n=2 Tax=Thiothrix fructosivorans TaxID=111770 RepID=A0A8B0SHF9_9GAMM|nr:recombinase family protein [Thiothrix fructosivorans]QTX11573.1 recombinase family protein [Thiothrix fructosivorans]
MKIGYARVSSTGQDYQTQLDKLQAAGCKKIFFEKQSGKSADDRAELQKALDFLELGGEGWTLVVTKLDRLARSMNDLTSITSKLQKNGVGFIVLDQNIDTTTPTGKLLFNILGSLAEFERDLINSRCDEGRRAAKLKGVQFGRKAKLTDEQLDALRADVKAGILSMQAIADKYQIARNSVYRLVGAKESA